MKISSKNYYLKSLALIFVLLSIFHIFFASCSQRGLYLDGGYFLYIYLDRIGDGIYTPWLMPGHPRDCVNFLSQLPIIFTAFCFKNLNNRFIYNIIYSFLLFSIGFLALWWNYAITKKTKQYAILFWSIFVYSTTILLYQIFAIVETGIGVPLQFVLLNYFFSKSKYSKLDIIGIVFLIYIMFGVYEHTIFIGLIIFFGLKFVDFSYNKFIKIGIAISSLLASLYTFLYMLNVSGEKDECLRFLKEMINFLPSWNQLNFLMFVITIAIMLIIFIFNKKLNLNSKILFSLPFIYFFFFSFMLKNINIFLNPVLEQHSRANILWLVPIIFFSIIFQKFKNIPDNKNLFNLLYIPVLLCGISLSSWGIVNTFFWNQNIDYCKKILSINTSPLCITSQDDNSEISSFMNKKLRRYIWYNMYTITSLAISPDYEVKSILMHYDNNVKDIEGNFTQREALFAIPDKNIIGVPFDNIFSIKNRFWDLSKPASALDKYNTEHHIPTNKNKKQKDIEWKLQRKEIFFNNN
jgi:hypothetical protein